VFVNFFLIFLLISLFNAYNVYVHVSRETYVEMVRMNRVRLKGSARKTGTIFTLFV